LSQPVLQYPAADPAAAPARGGPGARGDANLGRRTAYGFVWLMAQTIGSKFVGMAGQVVLAWLLMPEHLGLWAKASVVLGFAG
jgi:hypothetical protein